MSPDCAAVGMDFAAVFVNPSCCFCRVNIEVQMTQFAYYYIGIGSGVLLVSYFQVSVLVLTFLCISVIDKIPPLSLYRSCYGCQQLPDKLRESEKRISGK